MRRPPHRLRSRLGTDPPRRLTVHAAAKVNLAFEVGVLRPDGFHEVRGLVHTISLADRLEVRVGAEGTPRAPVLGDVGGTTIGLEVVGPEATDDLYDEGNLVFEAARALARRARPRPTVIRLHKEIPVAAGLGGGSADAAGTLLALDVAWGAKLTPSDLIGIGAEVGSDVPAILLGGLVHVAGRGERVTPVGAASVMELVVGVPPGRLPVADVYRRLDELRAAGVPGDAPGLGTNDLERAAVSLVPEIAVGLRWMRDAGATASFVSGSGPAVVGVFDARGVAREVVRQPNPPFRRTFACEPVPWGVRIRLGREV